MVLAHADILVTSMLCLVKQVGAGANTLKMGIYTAAGARVGSTAFGDTTTTGLKDLLMGTPVTLTAGTLYYLAILVTSNSSRVLGRSAVGEPGTMPIVSWLAPNQSDIIADVSSYISNTNTNRAWVAGR
jgi:hypothetical protein